MNGPEIPRPDYETVFDQHLEAFSRPATERKILSLYGVAGIGKTVLLDSLQRRVKSKEGLCGDVVVLAKEVNELEVLLRLLVDLKRLRVPLARSMPVLFVMFQRPGGALRFEGKVFWSKSGVDTKDSVLQLALSVVGLIPGIAEVVGAVKFASQVAKFGFKHPEVQKFMQARMSGISPEDRDRLSRMDNSELESELRDAFVGDLANFLASSPTPGPVVLLFDQYDQIWRGGLPADDWLFRLHEELAGSPVLLVVAGRRKWQAWDGDPRVDCVEVTGFDARTAREFLAEATRDARAPWNTKRLPEPLIQAILDLTQSSGSASDESRHHCQGLALCAKVVSRHLEKGQSAASKDLASGHSPFPPPEEFRRLSNGALDGVTKRLLDDFVDSADRDTPYVLKCLALEPRFDRRHAMAIAQSQDLKFTGPDWDSLVDVGLVTDIRDPQRAGTPDDLETGGAYEVFPPLAKFHRLQGDQAKQFHCWAYEHWKEAAGHDDLERRGRAWYHRRSCDPAAARQDLDDLRTKAFSAQPMRLDNLRALVRWWSPISLDEPPASLLEAIDFVEYAESLFQASTGAGNAGPLGRALAHVEAALPVLDREADKREWAQALDLRGRLHTEPPWGDLEQCRAALEDHEAARSVWERLADKEKQRENRRYISNAYERLFEADEAEVTPQVLCSAIAIGRQALAASSASEDVYIPDITFNLAAALGRQEPTAEDPDHAEAHRLYDELLRDAKAKNDGPDVAYVESNKGALFDADYRRMSDATSPKAMDLLRSAITSYTNAEAALADRSGDYAELWANTQYNLGLALQDLADGDRADNLQRSIKHLDAALSFYSLEQNPEERAEIEEHIAESRRLLKALAS